MSFTDDRGYQWFASIHGLPLPTWCEQGVHAFLPWQRAYLFTPALKRIPFSLGQQLETVTLVPLSKAPKRSVQV